jgi:hypothetical protein
MNEIANLPNDQLATVGQSFNALTMVPPVLRPALSRFWGIHSKLFADIQPIAIMLMSWLKTRDISVSQIISILIDLTQPEAVEKFSFAVELQRELAHRITNQIRRNHTYREMRRRRGEAIAARGGVLQQLTNGIGALPRE